MCRMSNELYFVQIVYAEGEHVVDAKLVRHAPRLAGLGRAESNVKPEGSLRVSLGRLHVVMLSKLFAELQVRLAEVPKQDNNLESLFAL
jgi:hypothetical protein